jgi:hypothetical protein
MKNKRRLTIAALLLLSAGASLISCASNNNVNERGAGPASAGELRDGDLVFQDSGSAQSKAIKALTKSDFCHVGIYFNEGGQGFVYEAHSKVEKTKYGSWINRKGGLGAAMRLKKYRDGLPTDKAAALKRAIPLGAPYDSLFLWNDTKIYCSELAYDAYNRALGEKIGTVQKFRDFDQQSTAFKELAARFGSQPVPMEEPVITPEAMYRSPLLQKVK